MSDKMIGFLGKNIGIVSMWLAVCALGWKVLDRPSAWSTVFVAAMIVFCGLATMVIINPQQPKKTK